MSLSLPDTLTVKSALNAFSEYLSGKAIDSPRLSAEILCSHVTGLTKLDMLIAPEKVIQDPDRSTLIELIIRRGKGEPVAYLTGAKEFYGRSFSVDQNTLIPRPETEHIIEELLNLLPSSKAFTFADLGTGSGCIAVTIAAEFPNARGIAVDKSSGALRVAKQNASHHKLSDRIQYINADFTTSLFKQHSLDVMVTNPPYVSPAEHAEVSIEVSNYEPLSALVPGVTGYEHAEKLIRNAEQWVKPGGIFIMEMGYTQANRNLQTMDDNADAWQSKIIIKDLAGLDRHILAVRK